MNDFIFPSDQDRADNAELDRACAQIEALAPYKADKEAQDTNTIA